MSNQEQAHRIYSNIRTLLEVGSFPGSHAPAIIESHQFISALIEVLNVKEETVQPDTSSDGESNSPAQDAAGVVSSGVSDSGRGSRKRKSK